MKKKSILAATARHFRKIYMGGPLRLEQLTI